ncbi:SIMPL domain-containing protein [Acinetobacter sp. CAAS 2-6]|uniref:SIMPL domain-containing protein n=1 Tax=Acinetobacter sp. CAAS 2-6 TaxID=3016358 RepID=UPI002DD664E4|nr:SIMPL domain-containing protein [Acinetobacter sp. CAAS 2-6]
MRRFILSSVLLSSSVLAHVQAQPVESLNYQIINLQAEASREMSNDEMQAILFIEKSNRQPAELAAQMNQLMSQAIQTARKYPQVKVKTGSQSTYPIYDTDNRKLKEWRGRAEIQINSQDFKAASQLISELQQNFQTESISFSVSDQQRKTVENELMIEASKNFQQRAQAVSKAWNKNQYTLVNLNLNTNNYFPQPMVRSSMSKLASAEAMPVQDMSAGESKISVNANGSIQLK